MNDTGTPNKFYDVRTLGIEETDSCPCCKRQLKALVMEKDGGCLIGQGGEWICPNCGILFMPKSKLKKMFDAVKERGRIIKPNMAISGLRQ
jgi:uncharacterized protein with PIN domain